MSDLATGEALGSGQVILLGELREWLHDLGLAVHP